MKQLLLACALLIVFPTRLSAQEATHTRLVDQQNGQGSGAPLRVCQLCPLKRPVPGPPAQP